jgi:hypothetical protein
MPNNNTSSSNAQIITAPPQSNGTTKNNATSKGTHHIRTRTPLNKILGMSNLSRATPSKESVEKIEYSIREEARQVFQKHLETEHRKLKLYLEKLRLKTDERIKRMWSQYWHQQP